jgi:SpoVK/Ycf46/Vps4 family AAA+-type ATPase
MNAQTRKFRYTISRPLKICFKLSLVRLEKDVNFELLAKSLPHVITGADIGAICSTAYITSLERKLQELRVQARVS